MNDQSVVVGAGIAGLSAAVALTQAGRTVTLVEATPRVGGKLRTSRFAGLDHIDEGADAYLTRVAPAVELADIVGAGPFKNPTAARAAIYQQGLHRLPDGVLLGVPTSLRPLVISRLLSWRGKARAAADLVLPRSNTDHDSLGTLTRARFGDEVHDRLIDSLVGSIYAVDTDHYSLSAVPQLAELARGRSLALGARAAGRRRPVSSGAIFAAPDSGMESLANAAAQWLIEHGATITTNTAVERIVTDTNGWQVVIDDGATIDAPGGVVLAAPAPATATICRNSGWNGSAAMLSTIEAADVIMVRLRIPADQWPARLAGLSGYLVPKPDQRWVTAASFGSQKWEQWQPENGDQVLRVSIGRDGMACDHLGDDEVIRLTIDDLNRQLDLDLSPTEQSITRWLDGFPLYRPHHTDRVREIEDTLPPGVSIAGASFHGIGVPACVASGRVAANLLTTGK